MTATILTASPGPRNAPGGALLEQVGTAPSGRVERLEVGVKPSDDSAGQRAHGVDLGKPARGVFITHRSRVPKDSLDRHESRCSHGFENVCLVGAGRDKTLRRGHLREVARPSPHVDGYVPQLSSEHNASEHGLIALDFGLHPVLGVGHFEILQALTQGGSSVSLCLRQAGQPAGPRVGTHRHSMPYYRPGRATDLAVSAR